MKHRMCKLTAFHQVSLLLLCILDMTLMTSGLPRLSHSSDDATAAKQDNWDVFFPSLFLHNWKIQTMSAPTLEAAASNKRGPVQQGWLFGPQRMETSLDGVLPQEWASQSGGMVKRNMVMADDAAFREKSKMLTSMERQKWLNSYMQKLLVVNSA
ncbi:tuberoinfundibular peptide of 39 residues isoform X1 [Takifugu rubripes]|uniref:Tuberoinfundibular peptide of 39 residues n=2 Tax=Takifugu rubripes TaxID=31033 RepID=A0A3B5JYC4_TAKRU|nr:tuberoinfundibular peptide of 39 residues isoform X1 [Takifugu rubripes]